MIPVETIAAPDLEEALELPPPMEQETVIAFLGPRGSGKTTGGVFHCFEAMTQGIEVYANLPIDGTFSDVGHLEAKPFANLELFGFGDTLQRNRLYFLDEFDKLCASRRSMSNANQLLNWLGTQIRKKGSSFILTAQDMYWIDGMWRSQFDVIIHCKDMFFTAWGKAQGVVKGALIHLRCCDLSGVVTGRSYWDTGEPYAEFLLNARGLWNKFDTYKTQGMDELLSRFEFKKKVYKVGFEEQMPDRPDISGLPVHTPMTEYVTGVLHDLANAGHREISGRDLDGLLRQQGIEMEKGQRGRLLKRLGLQAERRKFGGVDDTIYRLGGFYGPGGVDD